MDTSKRGNRAGIVGVRAGQDFKCGFVWPRPRYSQCFLHPTRTHFVRQGSHRHPHSGDGPFTHQCNWRLLVPYRCDIEEFFLANKESGWPRAGRRSLAAGCTCTRLLKHASFGLPLPLDWHTGSLSRQLLCASLCTVVLKASHTRFTWPVRPAHVTTCVRLHWQPHTPDSTQAFWGLLLSREWAAWARGQSEDISCHQLAKRAFKTFGTGTKSNHLASLSPREPLSWLHHRLLWSVTLHLSIQIMVSDTGPGVSWAYKTSGTELSRQPPLSTFTAGTVLCVCVPAPRSMGQISDRHKL